MLTLIAEMKLRGPGRGGLPRPVKNGFRPSFNYDGQLVACEVWSQEQEEAEFVPLERAFVGKVLLPYGSQLGWAFKGGELFSLNLASQVIGDGAVQSQL